MQPFDWLQLVIIPHRTSDVDLIFVGHKKWGIFRFEHFRGVVVQDSGWPASNDRHVRQGCKKAVSRDFREAVQLHYYCGQSIDTIHGPSEWAGTSRVTEPLVPHRRSHPSIVAHGASGYT